MTFKLFIFLFIDLCMAVSVFFNNYEFANEIRSLYLNIFKVVIDRYYNYLSTGTVLK